MHQQNLVIESLQARIKELHDNLYTVNQQVEANEELYRTQIDDLKTKYDKIDLEYTKKERLQALDEMKRQEEKINNDSLINVYKS